MSLMAPLRHAQMRHAEISSSVGLGSKPDGDLPGRQVFVFGLPVARPAGLGRSLCGLPVDMAWNGPPCRSRRKSSNFRARVEWLGLLICPTGCPAILMSSPICKNISLHPSGKSSLQIRAIPSHTRGVSRSSRTRDGVRWTRQRLACDGIAGRVDEAYE